MHFLRIFLVSLFSIFYTFLATPTVLAAPGTSAFSLYWKFDETTAGSTAVDSSGYNNNGTPSGDGGTNSKPQPITPPDPVISFTDPKTLSFDGTDDVVSKSGPSGLNTGTDPRSLSVWLHPTSHATLSVPVAFGMCAAQGASHEGEAFGIILDTSNVIYFWGCGGSYDFSTGVSVSDNAWTNIIVTYDGTNVKVYKNGTQAGSTTARTLKSPTVTAYFQAGGVPNIDSSGRYFTGYIDDVRYYNRVLSTTEISEIASGTNTSATWTGAASTNYETAGNWNPAIIPEPYSKVTITGGFPPFLTAHEQLSGLTINSSTTLNLGGFNLTMNDSGTFSNEGTLTLLGSETISNFTNDTDSGTIRYQGSLSYSALKFGNSYYNLTFNNNSGTWTLANDLTVSGDLTVSNGTLDVSTDSYDINVAGDWSNSGTFTARSGTVTLNGSDQAISGSTSFYNLTKSVTSSDTLTFGQGTTTTISNTLTLTGDDSNLLSLRSSLDGTAFKIDPQGTRNIDYVDVKDSNNINATEIAYSANNTYGSNLTNWATEPDPTPTPTPQTPSSQTSSETNSSSAPSCTDTAPQGIPDLFQVDATENSANLTFTTVQNSRGYQISYGLDESASQFGDNFDYSGPLWTYSRTINNLSTNTKYYFKIQAINGCNAGGFSKVVSVQTKGAPATDTTQAGQSFVNTTNIGQLVEKTAQQAAKVPVIENVVDKKIEVTKSEMKPKTSLVSYIVKAGDNLWSIAEKIFGTGTMYAQIIEQNVKEYPGLLAEQLEVGQELTLQKDEPPVEAEEEGATKKMYDLDVKILASSGTPLQGVSVTLHSTPRTEITNAEGIAHFKGVEGGEHKVYLAYNGYDGGGQAVNVTGDNKNIELIMQVDLKASLSNPVVTTILVGMGIIIFLLLLIIFRKKHPFLFLPLRKRS